MNILQKKYREEIISQLAKELGTKNRMQVPRLEKIVLNVGMGEAVSNPKSLEVAYQELAIISGQRPVKTRARKSIAGFKLRAGMAIGCKVTLRKAVMFSFLERLIYITIPRVRDFRGLDPNAFDGFGNYNISLKEQIVFPEINVDKVDSYHGINITFVTNTYKDNMAHALLLKLGLPFRRESGQN